MTTLPTTISEEQQKGREDSLAEPPKYPARKGSPKLRGTAFTRPEPTENFQPRVYAVDRNAAAKF